MKRNWESDGHRSSYYLIQLGYFPRMVDMEQLKLKIYKKWNCKESADDAIIHSIKYTQIQFNYFSATIFIGISFQQHIYNIFDSQLIPFRSY